ncbi:MAG: DUF2927 domain-containing protein [Tabrizicola sp.]|jgi:hypothetical protein|nr:DUF2927 domain-containing protein [Tabrizicola sp.]
MRKYLIFLCFLAGTASAEAPDSDGIFASTLLSDADFYRLATCGALPESDCMTSALRWNKQRLTLTVKPGGDAVSGAFLESLDRAARNAVAEVNGTGAGIAIDLVEEGPADITILPTALTEGTRLQEVEGFSGAGTMGVGYMTVWSDESNRITEAVILISTSISEADLTSVMLEEVTQSLGFLFDVEGPVYQGSILSQTSNSTTRLVGQDAELLRLHYPP